jgi:antitoxin component HigA of HigAB toxin-antitoxin module
MSSKVAQIHVPDSYLRLIHRFPLRVIRNEREYDWATKVMEELAVRGEDDLDAGERDYLDALDELVSLYDQRHFSLGQDKRTPLQRLRYLLEQSETTPGRLKQILGCSQSLVSMILSGERELSKGNILKLSSHFKIDAGYFF